MGLTKILILCVFFLHIEASQSFRRSGQKEEKRSSSINKLSFDKHIDELKYKIMHGRRYEHEALNIPPYLKKRNRRFKLIHESMHHHDFEKKSKLTPFGHMEYQQLIKRNELPDSDLLVRLLQKPSSPIETSHKKHYKKHHNKSHHKIKKLRSKPEAGIMQKKRKI